MSSLELVCSEEEEQLRESVAQLLAGRVDPVAVLARAEGDDPYDHELWRRLGEMGMGGLLVPESQDGQGATARELGVVAEALGRAAAPVPFLGSAVLAAVAVRELDHVPELLGQLAAGTPLALAVPWTSTFDAPFVPTVEMAAGRLTGSVSAVLDALPAETLVVPAQVGSEVALFAVPSSAVRTIPERGLDLTRGWATVELDSLDHELLASGASATAAIRDALLHGAAMVAADQVGIAEQCLDSTVAYVSERYQFGRPVGSFQALKHRLADVWLGVVGARAAARAAACALADGREDAAVSVAVAKAHCSAVAVLAAEEAVQLHGGIGMTWEHPTHVYLKRAKLDEQLFGTPGRHRAALARLVGLPAA